MYEFNIKGKYKFNEYVYPQYFKHRLDNKTYYKVDVFDVRRRIVLKTLNVIQFDEKRNILLYSNAQPYYPPTTYKVIDKGNESLMEIILNNKKNSTINSEETVPKKWGLNCLS